ncbi:hypothetical protein ACFX2H_014433 [Malus domestica]
MEHSRLTQDFDDSSLEFQRKILERSGLGEETYVPEVMHYIPPRPSMAAAREEAEQVMYGALDNLFANTHVKPKDIGILVVNCSLFNPTPSLSAMIVNKYKLRGNIRSFNLGGMGCSAGVIAVDLAKDLLQIHRNTYAVVVSTENITQNWYFGNKKSMLIPNCLFRVGGSAVLLSNKSVDRRRAKYKLVHVVRTHRGANDKVFRCVYQEQDDKGNTGVSLSKDLMAIAGGALKTNIATLGPIVLPISEQLLFFSSLVASQLCIIRLTAVKTTSRSWHSALPSPPSSLQDRPQAEAGPGEVSQMTTSSPEEIPPLLVSGLVDPTLSNMRSKRSPSCSSNPLPAPLISQTIVSLGVRSGFLSSLKLQQVESKSRPPATSPVHHKSQRQRQISWEDPAQQRRVRGRRRRRKRAPSNVTPGSPPSSSTSPFLLYR